MSKAFKTYIYLVVALISEIITTYIMWNRLLTLLFPSLPTMNIRKILALTVVISWVKLRVDKDIQIKQDEDIKLKSALTKAFTNICYLLITFICIVLVKYCG